MKNIPGRECLAGRRFFYDVEASWVSANTSEANVSKMPNTEQIMKCLPVRAALPRLEINTTTIAAMQNSAVISILIKLILVSY
jgi:hypothetical protein